MEPPSVIAPQPITPIASHDKWRLIIPYMFAALIFVVSIILLILYPPPANRQAPPKSQSTTGTN